MMDVWHAVLIRLPVEVPSVSSWQRQSGGACQLSRGGVKRKGQMVKSSSPWRGRRDVFMGVSPSF